LGVSNFPTGPSPVSKSSSFDLMLVPRRTQTARSPTTASTAEDDDYDYDSDFGLFNKRSADRPVRGDRGCDCASMQVMSELAETTRYTVGGSGS